MKNEVSHRVRLTLSKALLPSILKWSAGENSRQIKRFDAFIVNFTHARHVRERLPDKLDKSTGLGSETPPPNFYGMVKESPTIKERLNKVWTSLKMTEKFRKRMVLGRP